MSTHKLSAFSYGVHYDNYLTYAMRMENRKAVEYLLARGVNPLSYDDFGKTALHYAIEFQAISMLCYLCEGVWESAATSVIKKGMDPVDYDTNKSFPSWAYQSWKALDCSATSERLLPLHFCAFTDSLYVLKYIVYITTLRTKVYGVSYETMGIKDMIELKSKNGLTPLLLSAQYGKNGIFEYLLTLGTNIYEITGKMQNVLHLAIINKADKIIRMIVRLDSEKGILKSQKDYRGKTPAQYDKKGEYKLALISIWTAVKEGNMADIQSVVLYYREKLGEDPLAWKSKKEGNTPLHNGIIYKNNDVVKFLIELGADVTITNKCGKTPADLLKEIVAEEELKEKLSAALSHRSNLSGATQRSFDAPGKARRHTNTHAGKQLPNFNHIQSSQVLTKQQASNNEKKVMFKLYNNETIRIQIQQSNRVQEWQQVLDRQLGKATSQPPKDSLQLKKRQ
eukprot:TRINITY_DN224_c0_g2_i1.p1 TRINITY_DN224_c0_g2~~TRINITY_DN224_c0_g2_i1.p1  ORF type:complete len:452 (+),score=27.58 TRINITY_DN224_c0_g2_i1:1453-2808(+)